MLLSAFAFVSIVGSPYAYFYDEDHNPTTAHAADDTVPGWYVGEEGQTCTQVCAARHLYCSQFETQRNNIFVDSTNKLLHLFAKLNFTGTSAQDCEPIGNFGELDIVPFVGAQTCYHSTPDREYERFDCDQDPQGNYNLPADPTRRRICYCITAGCEPDKALDPPGMQEQHQTAENPCPSVQQCIADSHTGAVAPSARPGTQCIFPFVANNKTYHECTSDDSVDFKTGGNFTWCSTRASYDRNKQWGECTTCVAHLEGLESLVLVTALPTPALPTPPSSTPLPTLAPTMPCYEDNNCDATTTVCVEVDSKRTCECRDGYVPCEDSLLKCCATSQPTIAPTHAPTGRPCAESGVTCDDETQICEALPNPHCVCKEGFMWNQSSDVHSCILWTGAPSTAPTHAPSEHLCEGDHGCDTASTICCDTDGIIACCCLVGFIPNPDDLTVCMTAPTSVPTASPSSEVVLPPLGLPPVPASSSSVLQKPVEVSASATRKVVITPTTAPTHLPTVALHERVTPSRCQTNAINIFKPYCDAPDRNTTIWSFPGSAAKRCVDSSTVFGMGSLADCVSYCSETLGGSSKCR
jgi:hypothetical protein